MDSDFIKGINKAIDAATGEVGGDYTYKYHTDVTRALDKLAAVIAAGSGSSVHFEICETLPQTGEPNVIYLVPNSSSTQQNIYDEYIWIEDYGFELIGNTAIDLDGYVTDQELEDALNDYVEKISGKGLSTNDFTDTLLNKLNGIEANAEANVQADWTESDSTSDAYIANKPTIPAAQVNSDWNANSGVAQILNKPTIPSALSDLTDDSTHRTVTDANKTAWDGKMDAIELTQAEYDALTPAQKSNGKFYCITDASGSSIIDDSTTASDKTWSSNKINTELQMKADASVILSSTLTAGQTTVSFSNAAILADSLISVYADVWYLSYSQSAGSFSLTFPVQSADMAVTIEVK